MPGPMQKPAGTRARRNAPSQTTKLPARGRESKRTPAWPLQPDITLQVEKTLAAARIKQLRVEISACADGRVRRKLERDLEAATLRRAITMARIRQQSTTERKLWAELWKTPQAVMWEKFGWSREVALYVRFQLQAEAGDLDCAKEARQRSDRLGLNPKAMASLKWEVERAEDAEERGRQRRQPSTPPSPAAKPAGKDPRGFLSVVS